ncbi:hypothetical protein FPHOBKDP_00200 [Listeria phage LPJP1]|nr:hypothetical protein FPHOBKDP_00200 [Listeria phage LPJP1]
MSLDVSKLTEKIKKVYGVDVVISESYTLGVDEIDPDFFDDGKMKELQDNNITEVMGHSGYVVEDNGGANGNTFSVITEVEDPINIYGFVVFED